MGNIIIDNDLITVATAEITVQSTAAGYSKADVFIFKSPERRYRMDSADKSDVNPIMYFDLTSAQTVDAIVLDAVNFDTVQIFGHASDLGVDWSTATFDSGELTVSKDAQTGRYKIYIPLTAFNYRWLAIGVPASATAVGSYTAKWEIGRVGIMDTATEFSKQMSRGYKRGADQAFTENAIGERDKTGPIYWVGTLDFGYRTDTQETDLTTLNNYDIDDTVIFYENFGDTSKVYFCYRLDSYSGMYAGLGYVKGESIKFRERV